jgi:anti-sigma regulatory factor (Ser/Thr protein kinase)
MGNSTTREFLIQNTLATLDGLAEGLREFGVAGGLTEDAIADLRLVAEEAVSNTIRHGYDDDRAHEIRVRVTLDFGELTLEIEDDARAFNPLEAPLPDVTLPVAEKPIGGLGILLLRSLTDAQEYRRARGKNVLTLRRASR